MIHKREIKKDNLPIVVLIGRVNVGKSTLFNRLIEQNQAIVSDIPGTTRTSNEGFILWRGKYMKIIDTGGLTFTDEIPLEKDILKQTEKAMKEGDIIIFVTDAKDGILPQEKELAKRMRRLKTKPVIFVANKVDNKKIESNLNNPEWFKLGLGEAFAISAANGRGVGDLLDLLYKTANKIKKSAKIKKEDKNIFQVSLIGKPNVGKSSIFNKLIGMDKVIVSPLAHTTREPHDTLVSYTYTDEKNKEQNQLINFVDTAGIRRKANVSGKIEREGISKSIKSAENSDIILFVIDGNEPITSQDRQLGGLLEKRSKSVIILLNKWDLNKDTTDKHRNNIKEFVYANFPHLKFAPIIFVSGKTGENIHKIFPVLIKAWQARQTKITTAPLTRFIMNITYKHQPSRGKGTNQPKILGLKQIHNNPPIFEMSVKHGTSIHRSYINFVENQLREKFNFFATPVVIKLSKSKK
jgi:GTP-binding protein